MKKYFFLFLAVLILITAFRQVVGVNDPITAHQFFTIISDLNMTPDHQIDLVLQLRDDVLDVMDMFNRVSIPGADDWSRGDRDILSFIKMIAEVLLDVGKAMLSTVPLFLKLVRMFSLSLLESLEYVYEFLRFLLRLLGIWKLSST